MSSRSLPWLLALIATAMLLVLGVRHRELRHDFLEHRRSDARVQRGSYVPAFTGTAVSGELVTIGETPANRRQVLIFLTSTCPFCLATLPSWQQLARDLADSSHRVQVVALTTDPPAIAGRYATAHHLSMPLVPFPDRSTASLYRAHVVPQTVVINHEGLVLFVRHGVIDTRPALDSVIAAAIESRPL